MERRYKRAERRTQNLKSLASGTVYRRRNENRRGPDDQVFIPDVHDPRSGLLALGILLMSCLDALFTLNILTLGGEEVNPGMQYLLEQSNTTFLTIKYAATAFGVTLLLIFSRVRIGGLLSARQVLGGIFAIYAVLIIYHIFLTVIATTA